jgi:Subtilase family
MLAVAWGSLTLCAHAAAAGAASPLPASNYTVRSVCAAPAPGDAGCLALELVPATAAARARTHPLGMTRRQPIAAASAAAGAFGLRPQDLHSAYQLPTSAPSVQTIAIVDAYNDLSAQEDRGVYDQEFGLPECSSANGCFTKVNQNGEAGDLPFPSSQGALAAREATCQGAAEGKLREAACAEVREAKGWTGEMSLDIEVSHAICQNCSIVLVEARSPSFSNLEAAEKTATNLKATEVSNSWGAPEEYETPALDNASPFNHPDTVITASSGDAGYLNWDAASAERGFALYPASSPHVVAVGGTRLSVSESGAWEAETVWNGQGASGGGCSVEFTAPPWQLSTPDWSSVGCEERRAVADVSADADPYTGVAVYDSIAECDYEEGDVVHVGHWCTVGGTSLASPLIASVFALAGGADGVSYPARTLYENEVRTPAALHDPVSGSNGQCTKPFEPGGLSGCTLLEEAASCEATAICLAPGAEGYDGPSGVGTPDGIAAFQPADDTAPSTGGPAETAGFREGPKASSESGAGSASTGAQTSASGASAGSASGASSSHPSGKLIPVLSALSLTRHAIIALNRARPKLSQVGFTFTISATTRVRVALSKLVRVRGHARWELVPSPFTILALRGRDSRDLRGHNALPQDEYRLTLTPLHGIARSIVFQIG